MIFPLMFYRFEQHKENVAGGNRKKKRLNRRESWNQYPFHLSLGREESGTDK